MKKTLLAIVGLMCSYSLPVWADREVTSNCIGNWNNSHWDNSDQMLVAFRAYNASGPGHGHTITNTMWEEWPATIAGVSGWIYCSRGYIDGNQNAYFPFATTQACDATHYNVGFCSGVDRGISSLPTSGEFPEQQSTPTISFSGGGSGDTETSNFANWQQVLGSVTLDGSVTFSSLGSRSGGITFGLPVLDVPQVDGSAISGLGTAMVDGKPWIAEVTNNSLEFINSSGQQLAVPNLTSTSTITYHVQYSASLGAAAVQSTAPTLSFGGNNAGITYSTQYGRFSVDTNGKVHYQGQIVLTSKGTSTGTASISLPLAGSTTDASQCVVIPSGLSHTGISSYTGEIYSNGSFYITAQGSNGDYNFNISDADFSNTSWIDFTCEYYKQ